MFLEQVQQHLPCGGQLDNELLPRRLGGSFLPIASRHRWWARHRPTNHRRGGAETPVMRSGRSGWVAVHVVRVGVRLALLSFVLGAQRAVFPVGVCVRLRRAINQRVVSAIMRKHGDKLQHKLHVTYPGFVRVRAGQVFEVSEVLAQLFNLSVALLNCHLQMSQ